MNLMSATLKDLEERNEALKKGIVDPKSGATAADFVQEIDFLKRKVALLEAETGFKIDGQVASSDVKKKLQGWNKSSKKGRKKRDDAYGALMDEAKKTHELRVGKDSALEQQQRSALEEKIEAKRKKRAAKDGTAVVDVGGDGEEVKPEESTATMLDLGGGAVIPARRHAKMGDAAAISLFKKNVMKATKKRHADQSGDEDLALELEAEDSDLDL